MFGFIINCSQTKFVAMALVLRFFYDSKRTIGILQVFTTRRREYWYSTGLFYNAKNLNFIGAPSFFTTRRALVERLYR